MARIIVLALTALCCAGCQCKWTDASWEPRIGSQVVYQEACVERSPGPVSVMPESNPPVPLTALCLPFEIEQAMNDRHQVGKELGRMVWKNWVGLRVFPRFVFLEDQRWKDRDQALALAKEQGLDLVVRGRVPYYLNGGTQGVTSMSMVVDIYDVDSGEVIWSFDHAGRVEHFLDQDYILFNRKSRMPESPVWTVANVLAVDMGKPVKAWNHCWDWRRELDAFY
ncbi:MAG: hypothetical protein EOM25_01745 [Deltaproteobacteria bacterium]|nr:hypothetical protein [Deltaproteobacteria bacterium]